MRSRSVVTTLITFTAGVAASVVVRRLAGRRRTTVPVAVPVPVPVADPVAVPAAAVAEVPADAEAVVLPFSRPVQPVPAPAAARARCGESGGRTKAGSPCAARATAGGRCHHHRLAA